MARFGEMDIARWWNTKGQLGRSGALALRRGFPRTHHFAQARSVFAVAAHRCSELFDPPGCVTLWRLPESIEEELDARWEHWLDDAAAWAPFFHVYLADDAKEFARLATDLRTRSQQERKSVFWAVSLNDAIDRETIELFRSREMLVRKKRGTKTADETSLVAEEKVRLRRHQDELRRLLKAACLSGSAYFQGNDRSPGDRPVDVGKTAAEILGQVLPQVFDRFKEAAAKSGDLKKGVDALSSAENLKGLPPVFASLELLRDEKGKTVFRVESGPLAEVLARIEERASYGDTASGRLLADEFGKEPYGWDFEAVRLFVLSLLRAGKIEATSKGQTIDVATGVEARMDAYTKAFHRLIKTAGWGELPEDTQRSIAGPLQSGMERAAQSI
ncbi:MAG TPA: BrxE family protein, partial [Candidatus Nanopelagicales bacterium]|nr:BrxE family protein [Candidatus Nanopelagicales bacterium]